MTERTSETETNSEKCHFHQYVSREELWAEIQNKRLGIYLKFQRFTHQTDFETEGLYSRSENETKHQTTPGMYSRKRRSWKLNLLFTAIYQKSPNVVIWTESSVKIDTLNSRFRPKRNQQRLNYKIIILIRKCNTLST